MTVYKNQEGLAGALLSFFLLLCKGPRGSGVGNAECNEAKSPQGNAGGPVPTKDESWSLNPYLQDDGTPKPCHTPLQAIFPCHP